MNEKGIFYQSLSIAIIVHLIIALVVSHTVVWTQIADNIDKGEPIYVDVAKLPDLGKKTVIPKDSSKGKFKPGKFDGRDEPVPPRKTVPPPVHAKAAAPAPRSAPAAKPEPPRPAVADSGRHIEQIPTTEIPITGTAGAAGSKQGTYATGRQEVAPRRLVQPTVEDLMRYAKVDREPKDASPENTITMDTDDLKYTSYMLGLKRRIETIWQYPETSRRQGEQGELVIRFVITKSGKLREAEVVKSSGYPQLDKAATQALWDASPFNPLPDSWEQDEFQITGNFIYRLYDFYVR